MPENISFPFAVFLRLLWVPYGLRRLNLWFAMCALPSGDIPEEAYYQQQKVQVDLLDLFRMVDQAAKWFPDCHPA